MAPSILSAMVAMFLSSGWTFDPFDSIDLSVGKFSHLRHGHSFALVLFRPF
jgi:hypothetical protein